MRTYSSTLLAAANRPVVWRLAFLLPLFAATLAHAESAATSAESGGVTPAALTGTGITQPAGLSDEQQVNAVVAMWATALRTRDGATAFNSLATTEQVSFGNDPRRYMKIMRVTHPRLYNHRAADVVSTTLDGDSAVEKIRLYDHAGAETLGIVHLLRDPATGAWHIHRAAVLPAGDEKGA